MCDIAHVRKGQSHAPPDYVKIEETPPQRLKLESIDLVVSSCADSRQRGQTSTLEPRQRQHEVGVGCEMEKIHAPTIVQVMSKSVFAQGEVNEGCWPT